MGDYKPSTCYQDQYAWSDVPAVVIVARSFFSPKAWKYIDILIALCWHGETSCTCTRLAELPVPPKSRCHRSWRLRRMAWPKRRKWASNTRTGCSRSKLFENLYNSIISEDFWLQCAFVERVGWKEIQGSDVSVLPSNHLQALETKIYIIWSYIWSDCDKLWLQKSQEAPVASFASVVFARQKQCSRSGSTWGQPAMTQRPTRWMRRPALSSILWAAVCGRWISGTDMNSSTLRSRFGFTKCFGVLWVLWPFSPQKQENTK